MKFFDIKICDNDSSQPKVSYQINSKCFKIISYYFKAYSYNGMELGINLLNFQRL